PTAMSTTLPRIAKLLNSCSIFMGVASSRSNVGVEVCQPHSCVGIIAGNPALPEAMQVAEMQKPGITRLLVLTSSAR
ncbi:MAG: hypothetical protein V4603_08805, partial [Pseudomonadota bacterium]